MKWNLIVQFNEKSFIFNFGMEIHSWNDNKNANVYNVLAIQEYSVWPLRSIWPGLVSPIWTQWVRWCHYWSIIRNYQIYQYSLLVKWMVSLTLHSTGKFDVYNCSIMTWTDPMPPLATKVMRCQKMVMHFCNTNLL